MKNAVNVVDANFLKHVGVLGMKWGKRKGKTKSKTKSKTTTKSEPTNSKEHEVKVTLKKKRLSELSNQEIKMINERLQLEKLYKDLTKIERSAGQKFVIELLQDTARQMAKAYVQKQAGEILKKVMK